jgi:hypothetical protein
VESWISLPKILNHDKRFKQGAKQKNSKNEVEPNSKVKTQDTKLPKVGKYIVFPFEPLLLCVCLQSIKT